MNPAGQFVILLVEVAFFLLDPVLCVTKLQVPFIDLFLVFALELEDLLFGLEDPFLFDSLCIGVGLLDDFVPPAFHYAVMDDKVCGEGENRSSYSRQYD